MLYQLRANDRTKLIPVVILTSSVEDEDRLAGYSSGADGYVRKRVDFLEFSEAVRQLDLYWLTVNEPPPQPGGGDEISRAKAARVSFRLSM